MSQALGSGYTGFFSVSGNNFVAFQCVLCVVYVRVYVNFFRTGMDSMFVYLLANGIGYAMQVIIVLFFTTYYYPGL